MKTILPSGSDGASLEPAGYRPYHAETTNVPWDYFVADVLIENLEAEFPREAGLQRLLRTARVKLNILRKLAR